VSPCLKGVAAVRNELEKKAVGGTLLLRVYRPVTQINVSKNLILIFKMSNSLLASFF
jgi:hypothetical protein